MDIFTDKCHQRSIYRSKNPPPPPLNHTFPTPMISQFFFLFFFLTHSFCPCSMLPFHPKFSTYLSSFVSFLIFQLLSSPFQIFSPKFHRPTFRPPPPGDRGSIRYVYKYIPLNYTEVVLASFVAIYSQLLYVRYLKTCQSRLIRS